jgi:hypothetical protein
MRQFLSKDKRLRKPPQKKKKKKCDTKLTPKNNNHLFSQQSFTASPRSDPVSRSVLQESRDRERNRKPMKVQAPGEIQIAEGTKKERLKSADSNFAENPAYCSQNRSSESLLPQVLYTVACSRMEREWETPQSDATTRVCEKKRGDGRRKKAQTTIAAPVSLSLGLFCRPYREAKPRGQKPHRPKRNYRVQTTEWKTTVYSPMRKPHVSSFTMSDRPLLGRM